MAILILNYCGILIILIYAYLMIRYAFALNTFKSDADKKSSVNLIPVTLLIPVRNEISSLKRLLEALESQDYPKELYEVIFVNDHSDDGSQMYLEEMTSLKNNYKLLNLDQAHRGKKQALKLGCSHATSDWIIQTDADCTLPKRFISGHANQASQKGIEFLAGPVLIEKQKGFWNKIESLELLSLTGVGMASFLLKNPLLCSGANLSYSKAFYERVQEDLMKVPSSSGDDMFLMIALKKLGKSYSYLDSNEFTVTTKQNNGPEAFFNQRVRWGSKSKYYRDSFIIFNSFLIWLTNLFLIVYLLGSFFSTQSLLLFFTAFTLKSLVDFLLLYNAARRFKRLPLLWLFPLAALFYYFYISLAGLAALIGRFHWKGRSYS
jgi:cellulose synthase/poly-beta-1,6-N-acetylglucosamine synthase-like glycosyltransferase